MKGGTPSELSPGADVVDGRGGLRRRQRWHGRRRAQTGKRVARVEQDAVVVGHRGGVRTERRVE